MITELNYNQKNKIKEYYLEWLQHGISTERADRPSAEAAISEFYKITGHKPPKFIWVASPLEAKTKFNCEYTYFMGQMDSYWISFYLYCRDVLGIKYEDKYSHILNLHAIIAKSCGWWYPFENAVVICERFIECHLKDRVLHNEKGMSVRYSDGFGSYNLNGVQVNEELVMTLAEKLDPKILFKEKNAEVRREIVRKIGMERIIFKCGAKVLDKMGDYELLEFDIGDNNKRPYLKMRNPSIQTWHVEGVAPGIKTVIKALQFRKIEQLRNIPIDEENGEEYYQQGDVLIWPANAKSVKRYPKILT